MKCQFPTGNNKLAVRAYPKRCGLEADVSTETPFINERGKLAFEDVLFCKTHAGAVAAFGASLRGKHLTSRDIYNLQGLELTPFKEKYSPFAEIITKDGGKTYEWIGAQKFAIVSQDFFSDGKGSFTDKTKLKQRRGEIPFKLGDLNLRVITLAFGDGTKYQDAVFVMQESHDAALLSWFYRFFLSSWLLITISRIEKVIFDAKGGDKFPKYSISGILTRKLLDPFTL